MTRQRVPLEQRLALTLPELAEMLGVHRTTLYRSLVETDRTSAQLTIPGGAVVPCWRSAMSGHWTVYRSQLEAAVAALGGGAAA